ncbi:dolichol-phosphate mannosyltransferase [Ruminococcaceae bacterium KH2T8]|nr:dolichol-phosphate mannosyltransferase [Ruminococcaceae bacterium KH2T8]
MNKLSVVIPTYNEKDNINTLVKRIDDALKDVDHEIFFVDDSTDETPSVLEAVSQEKPHVNYIHREGEKGLATAVLLGFKSAHGDYLACMDADLQHPPEILLPMYVTLENGADMCIPSRLIPGGSDGGLNWYRKLISGTARNIGKIMLPCLRKVSDPTSGLFMFRREIIENADMRPIGWKIMIEVLATARLSKITEIPYTFAERHSGESKIDSQVTFQYLKQCVDLRKRYVKDNKIEVTKWTSQETEDKVRIFLDSIGK